jgi:hypothetical protein
MSAILSNNLVWKYGGQAQTTPKRHETIGPAKKVSIGQERSKATADTAINSEIRWKEHGNVQIDTGDHCKPQKEAGENDTFSELQYRETWRISVEYRI